MNYVSYKHYGKCACLSKGGKTMLVTVEVGPRIIYYGYDGGENIFFEDTHDAINRGGEYYDKNLPGKGIWHIYGGHRLWKSPEYDDTYYPDNAPVVVTEDKDGVHFTSDVELNTGLQKTVTICMDDQGNATVTHTFTNKGKTTTPKIACWALSVMDAGAVANIPLSTQDTGLLPNRNIVFWSYTDIQDPRMRIENDHIVVSQAKLPAAFKIGTYVEGAVSVTVKGMKFSLQFTPEGSDYADFTSNLECYTSDKMLEIETISSLRALAPNESMSHVENWTLEKI